MVEYEEIELIICRSVWTPKGDILWGVWEMVIHIKFDSHDWCLIYMIIEKKKLIVNMKVSGD